MRAMPNASAGLTIQALVNSRLVVAGLLLLGVGLGDSIAGHSKIAQYEELLRTSAAPVAPDPTALFPTASESQERHQLARAKLAFYHLLLTAGQLLSALGFALLAIGLVRLRRMPPPPGPIRAVPPN
jgi:hypothetical protein